MGYYYDVAFCLTSKGKAVFDKRLADESVSVKTRDEIERLLKYADKHFIDDSGAEVWFWKDVK